MRAGAGVGSEGDYAVSGTRPPLLLIAGYGEGLGAALAQRFVAHDYRVVGLSRTGMTTAAVAGDQVIHRQVDVADAAAFGHAWAEIRNLYGAPAAVIHNAAEFIVGPFSEQTPARFEQAWRSMVLSAVIVAQATFPAMIAAGGGSFLISGATASVRGGAGFAPFASAKFALRGLAQSWAREFQGQGIHVVHVILDGIIGSARSTKRRPDLTAEQVLDPVAIADIYRVLVEQPPSAWTHELDLRPRTERF